MARPTAPRYTVSKKIDGGVEYYSRLVTVGASEEYPDGSVVVVRVVSWQNRSGRYGVPRIYVQPLLSGNGDTARYGKATGISLEVLSQIDEDEVLRAALEDATAEWLSKGEYRKSGRKAGGAQRRLSETDARMGQLEEQLAQITAALQTLTAPKGRSRSKAAQ